jgi:hypothetical protein
MSKPLLLLIVTVQIMIPRANVPDDWKTKLVAQFQEGTMSFR